MDPTSFFSNFLTSWFGFGKEKNLTTERYCMLRHDIVSLQIFNVSSFYIAMYVYLRMYTLQKYRKISSLILSDFILLPNFSQSSSTVYANIFGLQFWRILVIPCSIFLILRIISKDKSKKIILFYHKYFLLLGKILSLSWWNIDEIFGKHTIGTGRTYPYVKYDPVHLLWIFSIVNHSNIYNTYVNRCTGIYLKSNHYCYIWD